MNGLARAVASGAAGALAVTAVHELGRDRIRGAPRMDVTGRRALKDLGVRRRGKDLQRAALVSELVTNACFYAFASGGRPLRAPWRGLALGVAAGLGAIWLGPRLGLGWWPSRRSDRTTAMTVAWYAFGGLASGLVARALAGPSTPVRDARWEVFEPALSPSFPALR